MSVNGLFSRTGAHVARTLPPNNPGKGGKNPPQLEEPEKVLGGRTPLNVVYDQAGTVFCYDRESNPPVRHPMADRGTLKYRCPARHQGWDCPSDGRCNEGRSYGLTVRVDQEIDLRRFPSVPRATR